MPVVYGNLLGHSLSPVGLWCFVLLELECDTGLVQHAIIAHVRYSVASYNTLKYPSPATKAPQSSRLAVAFVSYPSTRASILSYCNINRFANYDVQAANRFGPDLFKFAIQFELLLVTHADPFN